MGKHKRFPRSNMASVTLVPWIVDPWMPRYYRYLVIANANRICRYGSPVNSSRRLSVSTQNSRGTFYPRAMEEYTPLGVK